VNQCLPFSHPTTAGDVRRLLRILREALHGINYTAPEKISVLNLACGRADETGAIAAALGARRLQFYLGIDLRAETIREASRRWKSNTAMVEFRCGDASSIHRMESLPPLDLIFIRHQNYWDDPITWDRLLTNALSALGPEGLLICTSYFDREHELLKAALKTRGSEILWDMRHMESRNLPEVRGKSVDRHLAIFHRIC
jgi:Methyltransferase domain